MINFELSNLPATEDLCENYAYKVESIFQEDTQKKATVITREAIDPTTAFSQASRDLKTSSAAPYLGRNCFLCEHSDTAFAATCQANKVMWCMSCGRRFYKGNDITDYGIWKPPLLVPESSANIRDDAESVVFNAGLNYLAQEIRTITSNDIDASEIEDKMALLEEHFSAKTDLYYDPDTKMLHWHHPEIRALKENRVTLAGVMFGVFLTVGTGALLFAGFKLWW